MEAPVITSTTVRCKGRVATRPEDSSRGVERPEATASTSRSAAQNAACDVSNTEMQQVDATPPSSDSSAEANAGSLSRTDDDTPPPLLMLQTHLQGVSDQSVLALVDSGASYNFISKRLVTKLGWRTIAGSIMKVRLANGDRMESSGIVSGLVQCGKWQARVRFVVLDLTFDCVLGVPWLTMTNPRLDWVKRTLAVQMGNRWVQLPAISNPRAMASVFQPCHAPVPSSTVEDPPVTSADEPVDVDWARAEQCLRSKTQLYTVDACVDSAKVALNAGCMLGEMSCPVCKSVLMETSTEAVECHSCPHCSHSWNGPKVVANPLAALRPYLSSAGVLCFESQRPWEVVSAAKFARLSRQQPVHLALIEECADLNFTHRSAHGGQVKEAAFEGSRELLGELETVFPKVFDEPQYPITANRTPFTIELIDPALPPKRRKLYPMSSLELDELRTQIKMLLESGRIVPSSSPYGAPVLFAEKKGGGGLRMCTDYRSLNANTVTDSWPLPRIDEMLARLKGAKYFSKLDLRDGYHQIPIAERDRFKTAFTCRYGTFNMVVMPFGLKNAPSHFQRSMNLLMSELLDTCVLVYMDDILIFSKSAEEHRQHVMQVFEKLNAHNWHVKSKKCALFLPEVEFLGHVVSADGIKVAQTKVDAVAQWPVPTCVRDVQAFLGLANFYRRFVRRFADIARPLTDLTRKDVEFVWTAECAASFKALKTALTTAPVLQVFDDAKPSELWVDASQFAVGATLVQPGNDGKMLPVEYLSHRLSAAERNYDATDREFVAILAGLRRWRHYLVGTKFIVRSDHASLKWLQSQPNLSRRQVRTLDFCSQFDFEVVHVPGKHNVVADALSRRPDLAVADVEQDVAQSAAVVMDTQGGSDLLMRLRSAQQSATEEGWADIAQKAQLSEVPFVVRDGLVCRTSRHGSVRIAVPADQELRKYLITLHHATPLAGHLGLFRTLNALRDRYWWVGMGRDVKRFCSACVICQQAKVSTQKPPGPLQPLQTPDHCFEEVTTDVITHLPMTERGHDAILTFVCRLSKYAYYVPCKSTMTAEEFADIFLRVIVARHGMPKKIISDRDSRFTSKFWRALVTRLGCDHAMSSAYHPQTDGQSERMHRTVEQVLRCYVTARQTDWDLLLPLCEFALNSTKSASTGYTPAMVLYGREPVLPVEHAVRDVTDAPVQAVNTRVAGMQLTLGLVRDAVSRAAQSMTVQANKRRRAVDVSVGSKAWLSTEHLKLAPGLTRKLAAKWAGPFPVVEQIGAVAFRLRLPEQWRVHNVFHASQLKPVVGATALSPDLSDQFRPDADLSGEYEVEDLLDHRQRGRSLEYLVKWRGYDTFEATWEPASNLTNCSRILASYRQRRGLR